MDNKEPKNGAYSKDVTKEFSGQENAEEFQFGSSTDASLNAASKSVHNTNKRGLGKFWLVSVAVVVIAVVSAIIATFTGPQKNSASQTSSAQVSNKTVSIGLKLAPTNLDIRNQSGSALEQLLIGNVYEGLVARNAKNQVVPSLAKSWEISKDGLKYTFNMRKGLVFSNGHKLTAKDAEWSFNELIAKKYRGSNMVGNVESAKAKGDYTFEIKLKEANAKLLWALSSRAGLVFDKLADYNAKTQAVGSGPYIVEKFVPNDRVVLKSNPRYKGANKAKTSKVVVRLSLIHI